MAVDTERFTKALGSARAIIDRAKSEDRDLTAHEQTEVDRHLHDAEQIKGNARVEQRIGSLLGSGDRPGAPGAKLSDLVRAAVPEFDQKGLTDTPSVYVPSTFVAAPVGTKGRAGDGSLWNAFPSRPATGGSVSYLRSTMGSTTGAAEVAPGSVKPTADWVLTRIDAPLGTFAVLSPYFSDVLLADSAEMETFLDAELSALVRQALDAHVEAVLDAAATNPVAFATNGLTSIRKGATAVQVQGFTPTALFVNPADAEALDLSAGTDGQFHLSVREKDGSPIWSLAVLVSRAVDTGKGYVVDTQAAGVTFMRSQARIALDAISRFDYDEVRARAEARGLFALQRPLAVAEVDLSAA